MRKLLLVSALCLPLCSFAAADNNCKTTVTMNMSTDQWLEINKVNVSVDINAAAKAEDVSSLKASIMATLSKLVSGTDWHIVTMSQKQDSSGLMAITITAVANVTTEQLPDIYTKVGQASKTGMKMAVSNVEYEPGAKELQQAQQALRDNIYQQSMEEAKSLSTTYGDAFVVQEIYFNGTPQIKPYMLMGERAAVRDAQANVSSSQKLSQTARVTFAAGCLYS